MEKIREMQLETQRDNSFIRLVKDFFNPHELWGRQNRNQFMIGLICTAGYFLANIFFNTNNSDWNPYFNSSNGLLITVFISIGLILTRFITDIFNRSSAGYPWYEKYMAQLITLLGLVTLIALQNLSNSDTLDAALWINIIVLLVIFIIAAGYFVEGSSRERILKIWFALLGYYFSIVVFFYFLERLINT
jgi:uncharacterized membrane protein SirB2